MVPQGCELQGLTPWSSTHSHPPAHPHWRPIGRGGSLKIRRDLPMTTQGGRKGVGGWRRPFWINRNVSVWEGKSKWVGGRPGGRQEGGGQNGRQRFFFSPLNCEITWWWRHSFYFNFPIYKLLLETGWRMQRWFIIRIDLNQLMDGKWTVWEKKLKCGEWGRPCELRDAQGCRGGWGRPPRSWRAMVATALADSLDWKPRRPADSLDKWRCSVASWVFWFIFIYNILILYYIIYIYYL